MKTQLIPNKNKIFVSLNSKIYPEALVKEAVKAFSQSHNVEELQNKIVFSNVSKKIVYEFFNYLLALKQNEN